MRFALALWAAACTGTVTDPDPTTEPDPDTTPSAPSGDTAFDDGWVPQFFNVSALFSTDPIAGTLAFNRDENGDEFAPYVAIEFYSDNAAGAEVCTVLFLIDDPSSVSPTAWPFEDETNKIEVTSMLHFGFLVPSDARVELIGCEGISPTAFGDPGEFASGRDWGVGVGTLRSDVAGTFEGKDVDPSWGEAIENGTLLGGSWRSNLWTPNLWASHAALGRSLLLDGSIETDENGDVVLIDQSQLEGGTLPAGLYELFSVFVWGVEANFNP
ncbi:MAG: hypothetical protein KTR31_18440 [Myxococcales bacterium]|nr:hypothetical protein [Myxococcales bacterium]